MNVGGFLYAFAIAAGVAWCMWTVLMLGLALMERLEEFAQDKRRNR